jgi:hypothetical protein
MPPTISLQTVEPQLIAAVHRQVGMGKVGSAWGPALDLVWAYLRGRPDLRDGGHNLFLYGHPKSMDEPMEVDFGVQVIKAFEAEGEVRPVATPAAEAAVAVHVGPYDRISETHRAVHAWIAANRRNSAGWSWEIYGDWCDDQSRLETTIVYLLD